jgi:hypothetical protein
MALRRHVGVVLEAEIGDGAMIGPALARAFTARLAHCRIGTPIVVSASLRPLSVSVERLSAADAAQRYSPLLRSLAATAVDMVTARAIGTVQEAIGIVRMAQTLGLPVVVEFALDDTGRIPAGETLRDAIDEVDAATQSAAAYFIAAPRDLGRFATRLPGGRWLQRIRAVRLGMDPACGQDDLVADLATILPRLSVFGAHGPGAADRLDAICQAVLPLRRPPPPPQPRSGLVLARRIPPHRPAAPRSRHITAPLGGA